jgi:hypothetical protein
MGLRADQEAVEKEKSLAAAGNRIKSIPYLLY